MSKINLLIKYIFLFNFNVIFFKTGIQGIDLSQ